MSSKTSLKFQNNFDVTTEAVSQGELEELLWSYHDSKHIDTSSDEEEDQMILDPSIFKFETKCICKP